MKGRLAMLLVLNLLVMSFGTVGSDLIGSLVRAAVAVTAEDISTSRLGQEANGSLGS